MEEIDMDSVQARIDRALELAEDVLADLVSSDRFGEENALTDSMAAGVNALYAASDWLQYTSA